MKLLFFLLVIIYPAFADSWTIETMPPDSDRQELVAFRGNELPLKTTVSPAAKISLYPVFIVDTVANTERWLLEFRYSGRQLISFRSVTFNVDGTKRKLEPADAPYVYARNIPLLEVGSSNETFEVDVSESYVDSLGNAENIFVEFDAARPIRDVELKKSRAEKLAIFHKFCLQKRKFLLGY